MWRRALVLVCLAITAGVAAADEGMWLFNAVPKRILRDRYGFEPSPQWLQRLQRSSVRFLTGGGSGSIVSPNGLLMTNHHVASGCLGEVSTAERDLLTTGFYAAKRSDEIRCPGYEVNVLMSIDDVTARVNAAVKPGSDPAGAEKSRRAVMNEIEKESFEKTGLRSDVVTLFRGAQYQLYRYKRYEDVRLVFAPERSIAFFGGDPDNFEYPRFCLDVAFLRLYENGQPAKVASSLRLNREGAKEGELVLISGHPGGTDRLNTVAHLRFLRDHYFPFLLELIRRREINLKTWSDREPENERRAREELLGYQNARKALIGELAALQDPSLLAKREREEKELREAVGSDAESLRAYGSAWDEITAAIGQWRAVFKDHFFFERSWGFDSDLFRKARTLVRLADERAKPNPERLREYGESNLPSIEQVLYSEAPIYDDLEALKLADSLTALAEAYGADEELVRQVLNGRSPRQRAAEVVSGTRLKDVSFRKQLAAKGKGGVESSDDPMIQLARLVDPRARAARKLYDERVSEPLRQAYGKIANAEFRRRGYEQYPDATFTLRLAFGAVKGYPEDGRAVPPMTTIGGVFQRAEAHQNREPFRLPDRWTAEQPRLVPTTSFNFVSTADIIGGNSGSPVVNREGDVVGIIFDGNIYTLGWPFVYSDQQGRAIAVHTAAIFEALEKIYGASELLKELAGR